MQRRWPCTPGFLFFLISNWCFRSVCGLQSQSQQDFFSVPNVSSELRFAPCWLPLSRRSRCVARHLLWLSSIIEKPKSLKFASVPAEEKQNWKEDTHGRACAHFLFVFFGEFCIHFSHHNLLSSVYRVRLLNNRCIRRWSTSTTVNVYE